MADDKKNTGLVDGVSKFLRAGLRGKEDPEQQPEEPVKKAKSKKVFSVWLEPVVVRQLKLLAVEKDKTQESLVNEALNLLFKAHDKPEIAPKDEGK